MENFELDVELSSLPKQKWWDDNYLYQFGGFWRMPQSIKPINRVVNNFTPLPSDVILATFPKSGTTWLKSLAYSIINRSSKHKLTLQNPHDLVPFLEAQIFAHSDGPSTNVDQRRIFGTHISYQILAGILDSCECRVIYLTRNPKDTLTSMWHFFNKLKLKKEGPWSLDAAVDQFCRGVVPCGPYYEHVIGYKQLSMKRSEHVMFVTYEQMMDDPNGFVKQLGDFLGCLFEGEEEVEEIVKNCSIEVLRRYDVNKSEESPAWLPSPYNSFFRKGVVGDYKNYLNDEAIERIDALTKQKFHSLGFMYGV